MDPVTGCPADYEELFREYFPMMIGVVAKSGIEPFDVQDVAMEILAKFIEKDGISYYDPDMLHDVGENPEVPGARLRKAKFKGMLRGFTATYVMQWRDKQEIRHRKIPYRLEKPVKDDTTWMEVNLGKITEDACADSEVSISIMQALRRAGEALDHRPHPAGRDYPEFVRLCVKHGFLKGDRLNRPALAEELGVSVHVLNSMIKDLREVLRPVLHEIGLVAVA